MIIRIMFALSISLLLTNCGLPKDPYERAIVSAQKDGELHNVLIGGLYFGMTHAQFIELCFAQNKLGLMSNGSGNFVRIDVEEGLLPATGHIEFYPTFEADILRTLPGRIFVDAWSPWNKSLWADSLLQAATEVLDRRVEGEANFVELERSDRTVNLKVDGNRRLIVYPDGMQYVAFRFDDLNNTQPAILAGEDLNSLGEIQAFVGRKIPPSAE